MRRTGKTLLIGVVVAALGAAGTVYAYAGGWTVEGELVYSAKAAKMPRGVEPSVTKRSRQAVVTWGAQQIAPGVWMDHYVVTAHSDSTPPKPDVTRTVAAAGEPVESLAFAAADVAGGGWRWTITPRFRNWSGQKSPSSRRLSFPEVPRGVGDLVAPSPAPGTSDRAAAPRSGTPRPESPQTTPSEPGAPGSSRPDGEEPALPKAGRPVQPPATDPEPAPPGPAESAPAPAASASSGSAAATAG